MPWLDWFFGKPLNSDEDRAQRLGVSTGVPTYGLDALSSAAYGPEAALTMLIVLGAAGSKLIVPLSLVVIALLAILFFSYRQTIAAYPGGGGSYTVASRNLGPSAGVFAAAALMVDYLLDVAVGIAAGVGALVSAWPRMLPHTLALCLAILALLTLINLRGVREAGMAFFAPTWLFVGCLLVVIAIGGARAIAAGGHPHAVVQLPVPGPPLATVGLWLLIRAFASGCTALTGVEAVSNGVQAFREPASYTARKTLAVICALLAILLGGVAWLVRAYGIVATPPDAAGYQSTLSLLTSAVVGRGWFYLLTMIAILVVLALSANTAFADFPRLCCMVSEDGYLPHFFGIRGRRLVYNTGIFVLATLAALVLIAFGGVTDRLIPLFAIGAFLAFTLSQAGMVGHWRRQRGRARSHGSLLINAVGALATAVTTGVVLVAKFSQGAWLTVLVIPLLVLLMHAVRRQYLSLGRSLKLDEVHLAPLEPPIALVPMAGWNRASAEALRFACTISFEIRVVHVHTDADNAAEDGHLLWKKSLRAAAEAAGIEPPHVVTIPSPYRFVGGPILEYALRLGLRHPGRRIAVVVPQIMQRHWYQNFLHNQRATALKALLLWKGNRRIVIVTVPFYLE